MMNGLKVFNIEFQGIFYDLLRSREGSGEARGIAGFSSTYLIRNFKEKGHV